MIEIQTLPGLLPFNGTAVAWVVNEVHFFKNIRISKSGSEAQFLLILTLSVTLLRGVG